MLRVQGDGVWCDDGNFLCNILRQP
jgi:hypothetical protein